MSEAGKIIVPAQASKTLEDLVSNFKNGLEIFCSPSFQEESLRIQFLNKFFKALGWDVDNDGNFPESIKPVVHMYSQRLAGTTKRPDYAFRFGRDKKFFVEAKKPSVDLASDKGPAYQARLYSYNDQLPITILTNFREFAVYDYRITSERPSIKDRPETGRRDYFTYDQYLNNLDYLYNTFSFEAVKQLNFDRYVDAKPNKIRREVDEDFLQTIEAWRKMLALDLARENLKLIPRDLNFAVQAIIDRIIFLRMAEDRGIEQERQLEAFLSAPRIYNRLMDLFYKCDRKYNSGLFNFERDRLSPGLKVDDKILHKIISGLYGKDCPYMFSAWDADILGSVYERFLGSVIHLTKTHQARIEQKPEVKKAGGVYYTPKYIVDYIVKNTVGKIIENKTPREISKLKILDPACGSGSFLVGAFQCLLDYHLDWYSNNEPEKWKDRIEKWPNGQMMLKTKEKKQILLNNIFGVDIDSQAVEVTKLSLLLKVLENETRESLTQLNLFGEPALPDLDNNIKCGNSLIGPDFYQQQQPSLLARRSPEGAKAGFDDEQKFKINAFDWKTEFSEIFKNGGFYVVIGNPPYVRSSLLDNEFKKYASMHFKAYTSMADLYVYFIEQAHRLLRKGGHFGMICSNKFMRAKYGAPLRNFLVNETSLIQIVDFGELPVFQNAATFPAIILTENSQAKEQQFLYAPIKRLDFQSLDDEVSAIGNSLDNASLQGDNWTLAKREEIAIFEKMKQGSIPLGEYVKGEIYRGVLTGLNEAFIIDKDTRSRLIKEDKKSAELIKPFLVGDDIRKYHINFQDRYLIFAKQGIDIKKYPAIEKHLLKFKDRLMPRPKAYKGQDWQGRKTGSYKWYEIQDTTDYFKQLERPKIVWPEIAKESRFTFDSDGYFLNKTCFFSPSEDLYLLGLLDSKLIWFYLKSLCSVLGDANKGGRLLQQKIYIETIPVKSLSENQDIRLKIHGLAQNFLDLHKRLAGVKTPDERGRLEREIKATDDEIDKLVYQLYGLTEEEIKVVEGV